MISVIVPIYNVEQYLQQCIDSIIHQTYTDLEIILVDDGSTDRSGEIADSYDDPRIMVFHTENRGLSAARNLGIDNAHGDYISFVDADDWIEPVLLESAMMKIGSADIFCYNRINLKNNTVSGNEALVLLINGDISTAAWGKIYKQDCFLNVRFPEETIFEDLAVMYKVFQQANKIVLYNICGYYYRIRSDSLSHSHNKQSIIDYWFAHRRRYCDCKDLVNQETKTKLLQHCAFAITRAWAWRNSIPGLKDVHAPFAEMSSFAKDHYPLSFPLPFHLRIGITLAKHYNPFSFVLANTFLLLWHFFKA